MSEKSQRKSYNIQFKANIAMEAIKGQRTINEIASPYGLHPNLVNLWRRQTIDHIPEAFSARRDCAAEREEELRSRLYQELGQFKVELDWLKNIWTTPLIKNGCWSNRTMVQSASADSVI
jgi:transposase